MKNNYTIIFLLSSIITLWLGCTPAPLPPAAPYPTPAPFSCFINGAQFSSSLVSANLSAGNFHLAAMGPNNTQINILLTDLTSIQAGTYYFIQATPILQSPSSLIYTSTGSSLAFTTLNVPNAGSITISSVNPATQTISGTFSATTLDQNGNTNTYVTNGLFNNIHYTLGPPMPTMSGTFSCKVNGVDLNINQVTAFSNPSLGGIISINASEVNIPDQRSITFTLPLNVTPGIYNLVFGSNSDMIYDYVAGSNQQIYTTVMASQQSTVTVMAHDPVAKHIKGVFSNVSLAPQGVLNPTTSVSLTNGAFDINYQ